MANITQTSALVHITIDGKDITVPDNTTVFDAARMNGIYIPTLCHQQNEVPVAACRLCVVDTGARAFSAACIRPVEPNLKVSTDNPKIQAARKTIIELLMADHPVPCVREQHSQDCELESFARHYGVTDSRYPKRAKARGQDDSSLAILVDHAACILCDRCVRACSEVRSNFVIARQGKGYESTIAFDMNDPMGGSSCVSCGECMVSCPTGALTNKHIIGQHFEGGLSVDVHELMALPVFKGVSGTFLELNAGAVIKRKYKKGDIIFKEGEFGSTAFYILEGKVDIYITSPRGHVDTEHTNEGWLNMLKNKLVPRAHHQREGENMTQTYISIDAPVDLDYDNPIAELVPGDLFGEMTCMSFYPRSATVRVAEDCVVLEMLRNVLDVLQKNKTFRAQLEQKYRERALSTHIRSVPIFSSLTPQFIDTLRDRVDLVRYAPGEIIVKQGDAANAFYLIRLGFVKVTENYPGGELVLSYLSKGNYFGEIGLLGGGFRTASCTALDHVEVVKIKADVFNDMLRQFPQIDASLRQAAARRQRENKERFKQVSSVPVDQFLSQGLMEAQSLLVLDLDRCTRCDQCVKACADSHGGVTRLIRDGLRFDHYLVATSCRQCRDPLCMVGCPVGAIRRKGTLEMIIEDWCVGCGACSRGCPYGNINIQEFAVQGVAGDETHQKATVRKATACNLCHDFPEPSCVYACPHDAAHRVSPSKFFSEMIAGQKTSEG